ncbi:MAG TPA: hypothetical protein VMV94_13215 [Phycisphaerae bacterium]|nr:hypothetical protein [Phycisphaerae bacterium]
MRRRVIVLVMLVAGCQTPIDVKQAELIQNWGEGNKAFGRVIEEYCKVVGGVADNHHRLQRDLRDKDWELWLSRHTQADGSLVSQGEDGAIQAMKVDQLQAAMALRDQASETIAQSERTWREADAKVRKAIEDFKVMTSIALSTNEDIAEAKKSAAQFADSALSALAGLAGGVGLGAAVVP